MGFERRPGGGWIQSGMAQPTTPTTGAQRKAFARALEGHKPLVKRPNAQRSDRDALLGVMRDLAAGGPRAAAAVAGMSRAEMLELRTTLAKLAQPRAPKLTLAGARIVANAYRQKGKQNR